MHNIKQLEIFPGIIQDEKMESMTKAFSELAQKIPGLEALHFSQCELTSVPTSIAKFLNLEVLSLDKNKFVDEFGRNILWRLSRLRVLDLSYNMIGSIASEIRHMVCLRVLKLDWNPYLVCLPQEIAFLGDLREISLSHCGLLALPDQIGQLTELHTLICEHSHLKSLPQSLSKLRKLRNLLLSGNRLSEPPFQLVELDIEVLDLTQNDFKGSFLEVTRKDGRHSQNHGADVIRWLRRVNHLKSVLDRQVFRHGLNPRLQHRILELQGSF